MTNLSKELIVFIGVSGSGKSSIGQTVANHINYLFVDADDFHENESKKMMATGQAISDAQRIPWISRIITFLRCEEPQYNGIVLAFSGIKSEHRDLFRQLPYQCSFFWLTPNLEKLQHRLKNRSHHFATSLLLPSQISSFEKPLQNEADITLIENDEGFDETIKNVLTLLNRELTI